ncbi:MAG: hypothetical protein CMJ48_07630, partial [Planctomycetaceae bacterium]|nr:hypothetical protein [Planctomycetaceae bacterium]
MTLKELRSCTCKELGTLAKRHQIAGWSAMRKDDLVKAIRKVTRSRKRDNGKASRPRSGSPAAATRRSTQRNGNPAARPLPSNGAASATMAEAKPDVDSIKVRAIDAQWLHVQWSISASMRARAQVALDTDWHRSQLVIRTMDVTDDDMRRGAHVCVGDVVVDKRAGSWCVRVDDPQRSYRLQLGYLSPAGRFFSLVRSRLIQ